MLGWPRMRNYSWGVKEKGTGRPEKGAMEKVTFQNRRFPAIEAFQRGISTSVNATRLIRLISARSEAVARRVAQDPEGPFCPMKVGTARGFVTTDYQPLELRPNGASRATLR